MASSYFVDCLDELFFPSELRPIHACWFWQWWVAGDPLKIYGKCNSLRKKSSWKCLGRASLHGKIKKVPWLIPAPNHLHPGSPVLCEQSVRNLRAKWAPIASFPGAGSCWAWGGPFLELVYSLCSVIDGTQISREKTTRESNRHVAPGMVGPMQAVVAQQHLLARKERDSCKDTCRFNSFEHQKRLVGGFNPPDKY